MRKRDARLHRRRFLSTLVLMTTLAACGEGTTAPSATPAFAAVGEAASHALTVTNADDAGPGSLRQAILDANAGSGADLIKFAIPDAGPQVIRLASPLPPVTDPLMIDGYSQRGARPNTRPAHLGTNTVLLIELDGLLAGPSAAGLVFLAANSGARGLAIHGFRDGIVLGADGGELTGNFIGTTVSGTGAAPNLGSGIRILGANNVVGGIAPLSRNLISGNQLDGISIEGPAAVGNRVQGNYIGVDASGTVAVPNGLPEPSPANSAAVHITLGAANNLIGGPGSMPQQCTGACNVISGNHRSGVWIDDSAHHNIVRGNLVGLPAVGDGAMGNFRWGVILSAASGMTSSDNVVASNRIAWNGRDGILFSTGAWNNLIGGLDATIGACGGACNVIAFNGQRLDTQGDGVRMAPASGRGNSVLGNSILLNPTGTAIDMGLQGVTPNDIGDVDGGPNGLQNYPVLESAILVGEKLIVRGRIDTPNPTTVLIELFANAVPYPGGDPSGHGEGAVLIGRVHPDAAGLFTADLPVVSPGTLVSATATDASGNTSEFAANLAVVPAA